MISNFHEGFAVFQFEKFIEKGYNFNLSENICSYFVDNLGCGLQEYKNPFCLGYFCNKYVGVDFMGIHLSIGAQFLNQTKFFANGNLK